MTPTAKTIKTTMGDEEVLIICVDAKASYEELRAYAEYIADEFPGAKLVRETMWQTATMYLGINSEVYVDGKLLFHLRVSAMQRH